MRSKFRSLAVGCTAALAMVSGACETNTQPTPQSNGGAPVTETFTGTLQPNGDAFYSFGMAQPGDVALTLISMTGPSIPDDAVFSVGIGQPVATGCTASVEAAIKPGATPQHRVVKGSGVYCVRIADNARLSAAAVFVLNITHPR